MAGWRKRYHGETNKLAVKAMAANVRVKCTPALEATTPQIALPRASPPCRTSTYIEITRARTHAGAAVCAAVLRVARMLIHASPAAAENTEAIESEGERTSPQSATAKTSVAQAMTASGEKCRLARASTPAPPSAPSPKKASIAPKPSAPNLLAINGSNAQNTLAKIENSNVRTSTLRIRGSCRA